MAFSSLVKALAIFIAINGVCGGAQPSPDVQRRISAAIEAAANATAIDYTAFVNPFIGTDNFGDVCPGASVPFGMVKFTTDMTGYAPAGYVADNTQFVRGLSPLHDSGTGSSLGTYGNFEIMPLICPGGFDTCLPNLSGRERLRKNNTDDASPGYFSLTLNNSIQMEATSTRRAGLERFTFPKGNTPFFTLDLANDLPASFKGGSLVIDPDAGRITIGGFWGSSFGPGLFKYQAFACYDLLNYGAQSLNQFGVWTSDPNGVVARGLGETRLNLSVSLIGGVIESGALFSFAGRPTQVTIRVGVSFISEEQACANAEYEIGAATFKEILTRSKALWNERLSRIEIDVPHTPPNVTELLYSSYILLIFRIYIHQNNATGEAQGDFAGTTSFYFDSLYCRWAFRTFYPLMALHSPEVFAQIVDSYIDGYRKRGWMPECRANNLPGWTQGDSSGDVIVGHFAVNYHNEAEALGIDLEELYAAQVADAEINPPEWNIQGRQSNVYNHYGYIPYDALDTSSTGRTTREGSRTLEYAFEDFAIRQVALLLNKTEDEAKYANRSLNYRNVWDPNVTSDGFHGFMQKRFPNGTFAVVDPIDCSPKDPHGDTRQCSLQSGNTVGFYESSSWEYSWFAPHDTAYLVTLMGGSTTFIKRLNHFFDAGYYLAGNEPSFQTPMGYHYANVPSSSVDAVRKVVFTNFDITPAGLPGNDDQAAMATLLSWHLLGLYPVPGTSELLVLSPMVPKYIVHNPYLNVSTTVTVEGFDMRSVNVTIPRGVAAYVQSVRIDNITQASRCHFDFYDTFHVGAEIVITVTSDRKAANDCSASVPQSISTGGFATLR
ncbi:glycoside hydrolase family 92 protein [Multifurca ochricompacta]|uniref:Glycoside hydrolase family 92 protein n=1 Tax=Multifurca ochricompacta TaxID=376703 RepID=A0AAD4MAL1_9AGAM|nr:glycoside hydrolase family 92 protein [Multifurca ochricompacta]